MFFFCGTTKMEFFVKTVKIAEIRLLFWQKNYRRYLNGF